MRVLIILRIFVMTTGLVTLGACSRDVEIAKISINIQRVNQHPYLMDHDRELQVINESGTFLDKIQMYPDAGSGCNAYLYENGRSFIVVDCNGQWYSISKETGRIHKEKWEWERSLPSHFIGTYKKGVGVQSYVLDTTHIVSSSTVYQYKDPN